MSRTPKWFGGKGTGQPHGNAINDPIGTVRRAPNGEWIAIMWPARPNPHVWAVTDHIGAVGYETPDRVAHWPIVGAVPTSPAAGTPLKAHREQRPKPLNPPTVDVHLPAPAVGGES